MFNKLISLLQPAPHQSPISNSAQIDKSYGYWRTRICIALFLGYAAYYLTRKSFTYVMPYLALDLNFSKADLGLIGSALYITYGVSKFYSGAISDRSNPRYFMAFGLMLTGLCNIAFASVSSLWLLLFFWGLNGWFQAWGWPACCKCFTYWFTRTQRGQAYSVCLTSQNVGSAIIPLMGVFIALHFGWRYAIYLPAAISLGMGFILIVGLRDIPQSLGLPPIEEDDQNNINPADSHVLSIKEIMFQHVLNNRMVWLFAIVNFFVYFVRTAICDWGVLYLMEARFVSDETAAGGLFWFEIVGIAGMLLAGRISDKTFKGNRVPIIVIAGLGMALAILGLWFAPQNNILFDLFYFGLLGFFLFAPQMIIGLAATECVDKRAASSANGFAGTLGYLGAACACYFIGISIDWYGWQGYYLTMLISSMLVFLLLIPYWDGKFSKPKLKLAFKGS